MIPRSLLGFVFEHTDTCAGCSVGEFCAEGRRLIDVAQQVCKDMTKPVPAIKRSAYKA